MDKEMIVILDFGAQYSQLIARRVREANVYCEILPFSASVDRIKALDPKGIILSGGPNSVYGENAPQCDMGIFALNVPVLGICYGMQLMCQSLGGSVVRGTKREYGKAVLRVLEEKNPLFEGISKETVCWMSHGDRVEKIPAGFRIIADSESCPVGAMASDQGFYGVQFHPEVVHTEQGKELLHNFLYRICGVQGNWNVDSFIEEAIKEIREKYPEGKIICGLSGGVDSSVAAVLVHKAVGDRLTCIFVDHGLLRKNERESVEETFRKQFDMHLITVDAKERFLGKLAGIKDPETKRKIIGKEFIEVFDEESKKLGDIKYLVQGTVYPDVIESGTETAAVIKSHHNVGGLPEDMELKLIEPLRSLFKDEVRKVGTELGIPDEIVWRQPFPGPGLGIRILGDVTEEKLSILREADHVFRDEIKKAGLEREIWQGFAVLPSDIKSVGVMGDERTYSYPIILRAVTSVDAMTADWARIPYDVLEKISNRIINEVEHINRVIYDITSKPPGTIEWE